MSLTWLLPYIMASVSVILIPGQDMLFVLTQSISSGNRAGIQTVLGSLAGTLVHTLIAAAGLSIILQSSLLAFNLIKTIGAIYLMYLAVQAFREKPKPLKIDVNPKDKSGFFRKGMIMNLSNPKVAIFFLTFLPQFTDPGLGSVSLQILFFGIIFIAETFILFTLISIFAAKAGKTVEESLWFQKGMKLFKGTVFGGLGIKLLLSGR